VTIRRISVIEKWERERGRERESKARRGKKEGIPVVETNSFIEDCFRHNGNVSGYTDLFGLTKAE
jgi:hypothetical protein